MIAPNLKQGGFQRVCARTALLLKEYFEVIVVLFDGEEIAYPLDGISVLPIDVKAQSGIHRKLMNVVKRVQKVRRCKKEYKIDISYSFGMSANLVNVLSRVGDVIWCSIRSYIDLDTKTIGLVCRKSDVLICCSKVLEQYINQSYENTKTVTVYNPFDVQGLMEEAKAEIDAQAKAFFEGHETVIAAMGREDVLKGYWHLIKGLSKIERKDVALCIIGNGEFKQEKQLVKKLGLEERVYFTGGQRNPFAYLKYADIYVMSSIHEGFPNALVEAMALGIPVISTDCETGPAEILRETYDATRTANGMELAAYGILIPALSEMPDDTTDTSEEAVLADAIIELMNNTKLYEGYKEKAVLRAGIFNTKTYTEQFLKLAKDR